MVGVTNETNVDLVFLVIGLAVVGGTLISLRREHIRTEYSVSWLAVGVILTLLALFPRLLAWAARVIGTDLRTCFVIAGATLISGLVFEISHIVSKLRDENVLLAQRLAILEYHLHRGETRNGKTGS
jgi:hypothetical protein